MLEVGSMGLNWNLEQIVEGIHNYRTEEGNIAYVTRQIAREWARADAYVAKRKEENQARVAQGLAPLPEEDVTRLFKIPAEPSRLESMLLLGSNQGRHRFLTPNGSRCAGLPLFSTQSFSSHQLPPPLLILSSNQATLTTRIRLSLSRRRRVVLPRLKPVYFN
ncbi:hypothetical protein JOM56_014964 [Amanita muscaria]